MNFRQTGCGQNVICCNACTCEQKTDSACAEEHAPTVPQTVTQKSITRVLQQLLNNNACETSLNGHVNRFRLGIVTLTPCNTSDVCNP